VVHGNFLANGDPSHSSKSSRARLPKTQDLQQHPDLTGREKAPQESFWQSFPFNNLPSKPETKINTVRLSELIEENRHLLLKSELARAKKCVDFLTTGAPAFQLRPLPGCCVKNSKNAFLFAANVTDTIASWVEKKFVAGPFSTPPLPGFRANSILAVPQPSKTRICINVSLPNGKGFNDNINKNNLERVKMYSARNFGYSITEAGQNCTIAKYDIVDAYKNVPAKTSEYHYQGFTWLGKHFVELRQMFGAASSVQNCDILANTVKTLTLVNCKIPSRFVHRQLDDVPIVAPENTSWCREFYDSYKNICDQLNIELAKQCPDFDKAFGCSKEGKVLGIFFNTRTLSWSLPDDKRRKTISKIVNLLHAPMVSTLQIQSVAGRLNFISSMCPFLKTFKFNLNASLSEALRSSPISHPDHWIPIPCEPIDPPLGTINFWSDAAGFPDNASWSSDIGYGTIGTNAEGDTILGYQSWWNKWFITQARDNKHKRFGNKTATLEMFALLLPLMLIPEKIKKSHICIFTDNMSCVFGMKDGYTKNDEYASILIRAPHLISGYLGSIIHVIHCPRHSSWESKMADNFTRRKTTSFLEHQILSR
jgi:hypothetical protein